MRSVRDMRVMVNYNAKAMTGNASMKALREFVIDNHCSKFSDSDLRIPMLLNGIFLYFKSRKPTIKELHEFPKLFLTTDADDWNPHSTTFSSNEKSMLDFNGEMADKSRRKADLCVFEED